MKWFLQIVDVVLITPYRWPKDPILGWWLGTIILAGWAGILGELTLALCYRVNGLHVIRVFREMRDRHNQSLRALRAGDKDAYKAINRLANEAHGKAFFLQLSMSSASLWPVPFSLAWLHTRFSHIQFVLPFSLPHLGGRISYPFVFLILYVLARIALQRLKTTLSFFSSTLE